MLDALHADVEDAGVLGAVPRRASGCCSPGADCPAPTVARAAAGRRAAAARTASSAGAGPAWSSGAGCRPRRVCRPLADAARRAAADLDAELVRGCCAGLLERRLAPIPGCRRRSRPGARRLARPPRRVERIGALRAGAGAARLRRRRRTLEAIAVLDLEAPARIARQAARLGVPVPGPATRQPRGLTERQLDVLASSPRAPTGDRRALVVSTRTVDHHVRRCSPSSASRPGARDMSQQVGESAI